MYLNVRVNNNYSFEYMYIAKEEIIFYYYTCHQIMLRNITSHPS